ncbi:acyl-CoA dehydrogenase family protein [Rhodococcus qingshengii]|uniref:acyl-CoA dehydrogenase family protein n=1 Tax=Rhodococcus qingshengii TaxID=334542 RepID=UPI0010A5D457|nr:acyl-CoA dehydrogenase family protein [Rhodococcus qingshengii]THJ64713.1 acyl-CoA dehydrogenase [Rhodococcus qingshengii]
MVSVFNEDHASLRESLTGLFAQRSSESEVRRLMASDEGYDPVLWRELAAGQELQGLIVPEEFGGSGYTWVELGVVMEEMGRCLFCGPYFSTAVMAVTCLMESADETAQSEYLPRIASGEAIGSVAFVEASGRWDEAGVVMEAKKIADGYELTGSKLYVLDGHVADFLVVAARTEDGVSLFIVDCESRGVSAHLEETLDQTRKLATVNFQEAPARLLGAEGAGWSILSRVLELAGIALAAEQVGGARASLNMAVEYAKERVQFGQPIGAFQAIKHMLADVMLEVESARSAMQVGLAAANGYAGLDLDEISPLVQAYCSDVFELASHQNIQVHGGMGFTWEMAPHLYFKRAKSMALFLGNSDSHREQLAKALGV